MGLMKKFFNQTRKPEGKLGKMMLAGMNVGHAKVSNWGFTHLPVLAPHKVADIGCGAGKNLAKFLEKYPDAQVTGIDYSATSVEKAREYNKAMIDAGRCVVVQDDVSELRMEGDTFDLVTAFETIYFWPGLEKCFSQIAKILKNDGYFMICNEIDGIHEAGKKFEKIIDGMHCYTSSEIEAALKAAGLDIVKAEHHPTKPWILLLAQKKSC